MNNGLMNKDKNDADLIIIVFFVLTESFVYLYYYYCSEVELNH